MSMEWDKKEIIHIVVAVLLLTFIFGFNDGSESFNVLRYLVNLLRVALAAIIILLIFASVPKFVARRYGATAEFRVWSIQRFYVWPESTLPRKVNLFGKDVLWEHIYIGPIVGVLIALASAGTAFFCPIGAMIVTEYKKYRADQKFRHILEGELGKIAASGILVITFVAVILSAIDRQGFIMFITMSMYFVGFQLIPFSRLPGGSLFFYSLPFYIFTVALVIAAFALSAVLGSLATIILAVIIGCLALAAYFVNKYLH